MATHAGNRTVAVHAGVASDKRPPPLGLAWPAPKNVPMSKSGQPKWTSVPIALVDASHGAESARRKHRSSVDADSSAAQQGTSYYNSVEVELAVKVAFALCAAGDIHSLAILSPYKAQACTASGLQSAACDLTAVVQLRPASAAAPAPEHQ
jgi:hypothetical protein